MNRLRTGLIRLILVVVDLGMLFGALALGTWIRFQQSWVEVWSWWIPNLPAALLVFGALAIGAFWLAGLYRLRDRWTLQRELVDVGRAIAGLGAVTLALLYLFRLQEVSRIATALTFLLAAVGVGGARAAVRAGFRHYAASGRRLRQLLVVGGGERAQRLVDRVRLHPELGLGLVGQLADPADGQVVGVRRLGTVEDLPDVLADQVIDEVAVCLPFTDWARIDAVTRESEAQGKAVRIPVDALDHAISRGRLDHLADLPVLSLTNAPDQVVALVAKRALDVVAGALALLVLAPVLLLAMAVIWVTDGRPVLFTQERGGLNGRPFTAYKLRTMVRDAEDRKAALLEHNERVGAAFKIADDPRVTRVGRLLRRTSLDEAPQLVNVLKGDMSLVGPRPQPLAEVAAYDGWHRRRLSVRPGITGLWQVTARDEPDFDRWVELDLAYIDNWSLWLDLKLLARTPAALVRNPGD